MDTRPLGLGVIYHGVPLPGLYAILCSDHSENIQVVIDSSSLIKGFIFSKYNHFLSCFTFFFHPPIKIAEEMFPLSTPFLRLEVNPEGVSSHGPPCKWCKPHPMAALNSPPSAVSGSLQQEPQTPVRGRYPIHHL